MRTFALMAVLATYAAGLQVRSDEETPAAEEAVVDAADVTEALADAVEAATGADDGSNVDAAISEAEQNEAIAAQIDTHILQMGVA